uniref:Uncharacterized protein n=1 Tax=Anopheles farauti TaxID=69004 RepID=A0A182QA55_9DIPT
MCKVKLAHNLTPTHGCAHAPAPPTIDPRLLLLLRIVIRSAQVQIGITFVGGGVGYAIRLRIAWHSMVVMLMVVGKGTFHLIELDRAPFKRFDVFRDAKVGFRFRDDTLREKLRQFQV